MNITKLRILTIFLFTGLLSAGKLCGQTHDKFESFDPSDYPKDKYQIKLDKIKNADFAFVYYSGHGYTGIDNKGKVNINLNEVLIISESFE